MPAYALDSKEMREADRRSIEDFGIPSMVLMERAAYSCAEHIKIIVQEGEGVHFLCGTGNNAGDAIAIARMLFFAGRRVSFSFLKRDDEGKPVLSTEDACKQYEIAKKLGVFANTPDEEYGYEHAKVIVDGIFGTGLSRMVEGEAREMILKANKSGKPVIAVDIPSGINADNGAVMGIAIKATTTVTFEYAKVGLLLYPGAEYAGELKITHIGIVPVTSNYFYFKDFPYEFLPIRFNNSSKADYGRVCIVAGTKNMAGAAYFATAAAYATGAGLVRVITREENREIIQRLLPEAVLTTYTDLNEAETEDIAGHLERADAVLAGPGLGMDELAEKLFDMVLSKVKSKLIIDADAINIAAKRINDGKAVLSDMFPEKTILTPHKKEMSRLTGISMQELVEDMKGVTENLSAEYPYVFVKKDARTIVSFGNSHMINLFGNNGMSTAGSGDVLAGMIVGLLAQGCEEKVASMAGVMLHALAGDKAAELYGTRSMTADTMLKALPEVLI